MVSVIPNPRWVDRALNKFWEPIEERVGEEMMPRVESATRGGKRTFKEFGCGHYGCVIPANRENTVFKLTSDASEAAFVTAALSLPEDEWPNGMVRYYEIFELPVTHRNRRVFALWREEASAIGFPLRVHGYQEVTDPYIRGQWKQLLSNLTTFQQYAAAVRKYATQGESQLRALFTAVKSEPPASWRAGDVPPKYLRGVRRAMAALNECAAIAEVMEHTAESDRIGGAFTYYLEQGMLLADVHAQNVGVATHPPDEYYDRYHTINVITDPGHMVPLQEKWLSVSVPSLG